jgi:hypothetical protein
MSKDQFLRIKLIECKKQINLYQDSDLHWVNSLGPQALATAIDELDIQFSSVITDQLFKLRYLAQEVILQIDKKDPQLSRESDSEYIRRHRKWIRGNYKKVDYTRIKAYSNIPDVIEDSRFSSLSLSQVFFRHWSTLEFVRQHQITLKSAPVESTLETLEIKLAQILSDREAAAYYAEALEYQKLIPSLIDFTTEVDEIIQWAEKVLNSLDNGPF